MFLVAKYTVWPQRVSLRKVTSQTRRIKPLRLLFQEAKALENDWGERLVTQAWVTGILLEKRPVSSQYRAEREREIFGIRYFLTVCAKLSQTVPQEHRRKLACTLLKNSLPASDNIHTSCLPIKSSSSSAAHWYCQLWSKRGRRGVKSLRHVCF